MKQLALLLCLVLVAVGCQHGEAQAPTAFSTQSWFLQNPQALVWLSMLWGFLQLAAVILVILACLKYLFSKPFPKDWHDED
jgi:hypothetical protein